MVSLIGMEKSIFSARSGLEAMPEMAISHLPSRRRQNRKSKSMGWITSSTPKGVGVMYWPFNIRAHILLVWPIHLVRSMNSQGRSPGW